MNPAPRNVGKTEKTGYNRFYWSGYIRVTCLFKETFLDQTPTNRISQRRNSMKVKKARIIISVILVSLMLVLATAVLAQTMEKPYAEGMGGKGGSNAQTSRSEEKGYPEGQGAERSGSRPADGAQSRSAPEGQGGKSGSRSAEEVNQLKIEATEVRFLFSGVSDDGNQGGGDAQEATSVHCTNVGVDPVNIEVQIFNYDGSVYTATISLGPDNTATFSTQATAIFFDDVIVGGIPGTPAIYQGHGRVLANGWSVICSAQVLDPQGYPPAFLTGLEMYQP
jgi:hypothetical protein